MVGTSELYALRCVCGYQDLTDTRDGLTGRAALHESIAAGHLVDIVKVR